MIRGIVEDLGTLLSIALFAAGLLAVWHMLVWNQTVVAWVSP